MPSTLRRLGRDAESACARERAQPGGNLFGVDVLQRFCFLGDAWASSFVGPCWRRSPHEVSSERSHRGEPSVTNGTQPPR
jgi:hypothetical protein